jgi:hypothetical protein
MYRGDYIHHRAVGTTYRNDLADPTPQTPSVFALYISAFAYLLTTSQLGSFSSTTAGDHRMGRAVCQGGTIPNLNL